MKNCDLIMVIGDIVVVVMVYLIRFFYMIFFLVDFSYYEGWINLGLILLKLFYNFRCLKVFVRDVLMVKDLKR